MKRDDFTAQMARLGAPEAEIEAMVCHRADRWLDDRLAHVIEEQMLRAERAERWLASCRRMLAVALVWAAWATIAAILGWMR